MEQFKNTKKQLHSNKFLQGFVVASLISTLLCVPLNVAGPFMLLVASVAFLVFPDAMKLVKQQQAKCAVKEAEAVEDEPEAKEDEAAKDCECKAAEEPKKEETEVEAKPVGEPVIIKPFNGLNPDALDEAKK